MLSSGSRAAPGALPLIAFPLVAQDRADASEVPGADPDRFMKPVLVHGNTPEETVRIGEVRNRIDALRAASRTFEFKIHEAAPGGLHFNRIDARLARDSRAGIYDFPRRNLKP